MRNIMFPAFLTMVLVGFAVPFTILSVDKKAPKTNEETVVYNLSDTDIVKFIKAFPGLKATFNAKFGDLQASILNSLKKFTDLSAFAKANDFKDENDLLRVFSGTMAAYAIIKLEESEIQLKESINGLPPELAAVIKPQLNLVEQQFEKYRKQISPQTLDNVKKHYSEINSLFEDNMNTTEKTKSESGKK